VMGCFSIIESQHLAFGSNAVARIKHLQTH
jgi:hypothetical protein